MISFESDYIEGAHPQILEKLNITNFEQTSGYGEDIYCESARKSIKSILKNDEVDIHFLVGGTITNKTVICSALRPHQGVIAAETGHINVHETGAIEATGHKVLALPSTDGKITGRQVREYCESHVTNTVREHMVQPAMLYISLPTETGLVYSKQELNELYEVCKKYSLFFFVDGARLGYAMVALKGDLSYSDLPNLCDVFYIGGTKVGALFGEAVVIINNALKKDFRYIMKQSGAMLAKGRLLGVQFDTLFKNGLYMEMAEHALSMARMLSKAFVSAGVSTWVNSVTNQLFFILSNEAIDKLANKFKFEVWSDYDIDSKVIRICTSWATKESDVATLIKAITELK